MIGSLLLFGCSGQNLTPKDSLVIAIDAEPSNLDPRFALDATSQRIDTLLYDALVMIDNNLQIVPHLALNWKTLNDTTYQFTLRPNLRFPDGSPITADHFVSTLKQIQDPNFGSPLLSGFKNVEKVTALDPLTLEIRLKTPQASFLTDLTLIKAMPMQAKEQKDLPKDSKELPLGSGPYQLVTKEPNTLKLKRNPDHFKFNPKLENLVFKVIKDDNTRVLKLKKGEVDLIQNALNYDSLAKLSKESTLSFTKSPGITYAYLGLNLKDPLLKNKKVRQAIAYAIDREEIIEHLLENMATPANSILSSQNGYTEPAVRSYTYDPQKAKKLLKESGVSLPMTLIFKTSTDIQAVNTARLISDHLKKVGIMVELRTHEWGTFFNDIQTGNFQLFSSRWVGVTDPDILYEIFHSSNVPPGKNRVFYMNPKVDKLTSEGRITLNIQKRKKI
ncbi:MAG: ABC transporter substrate-binding protein, partial [Deltaproteobacteria bacterium]|nr:ABC transporter substrate-binding protein [Deltaproteobacteria bacterium]